MCGCRPQVCHLFALTSTTRSKKSFPRNYSRGNQQRVQKGWTVQHAGILYFVPCTAKTPIPKIRNKYSQTRNFHIHVSVSDLYIPTIRHRFIYSHDRSVCSAAGNMWTDPGNINRSLQTHECGIGTEAAQFPEKEYINGIFVAVCCFIS